MEVEVNCGLDDNDIETYAMEMNAGQNKIEGIEW